MCNLRDYLQKCISTGLIVGQTSHIRMTTAGVSDESI